MDFIPVTSKEKQEMLDAIGVKNSSELFASIPENARLSGLNLPDGLSELALSRKLEMLASKNASLREYKCFRGAGVYEHFIPALVDELISRSEFSTAYTPYQAEASQGTLQAVFEYQSMICELTGLDVSNASLYDGASAVAEAALLSVRSTGRKKVVVSSLVHPEYQEALATYLMASGIEILKVGHKNGFSSLLNARQLLNNESACLIIQSPNFLVTIEDMVFAREITRQVGAQLIVVANPISLGILKAPGEIGADIAVGEGQVLGNRTGAGGIGFGFMAAKKELAWKMPGRIVCQTTDAKGSRGFVLTLQSREQHIRREKATSNICTNSALNALAGCIYLSGWGGKGLRALSELNIHKSHYAFDRISKLPGFKPAFGDQKFFNEFVIRTTKDVGSMEKKLMQEKIIGPLALRRFFPELSDCLLFCVTETKTKEDIDRLVNTLAD